MDSDGVVEAGTLGAIETTATFYDTRMPEGNGCDPDGCIPSNTRVRMLGGKYCYSQNCTSQTSIIANDGLMYNIDFPTRYCRHYVGSVECN